MNLQSELKRIFCVGPVGTLITIFIWFIAMKIETMLSFQPMKIHPILKLILLLMFLLDAVYLIIGSNRSLTIKNRGRKLVQKGPYKYIRHPLYSALIYSCTGALAVAKQSWVLLFSVLPVAFWWSWLVDKEERYLLELFGKDYRRYQEDTGQFLPIWKTLISEAEERE